ncbi:MULTISPECIES: DUF3427 domain-containing protein [unclassified Aeromonas]|uniref:DUF3427 domain-containing protein n=1 Tax=unclassified Aeromonas TaxID=257493 RepID=UPI00084A7571|nr:MULTISPECIES: DUF3427 domain-containing protein [unclassified Aeromonas]OEC50236.1 hypothetical protein A9G04_15810 [Aeromonas sp. ANNP30]OEC62629.1 hypothetical protein A9G49_18450 [Aeromonas sp. ANP5]
MAVAKGQTARQKDLARELRELTAEHVLRAVETFEQMGGDVPTYKHSTTYDLLIEGRRYPPKAILGLAAQDLLGHEFPSSKFSGGLNSPCFNILEKLGFTIVPKSVALRLIPHHLYSREEVASIFAPGKPFTPGAGSWGLSGIISNAPGERDFVFFVTLGVYESNDYDDALTADGYMIWKSQNQQTPDSPLIKLLVEHDDTRNNVRLFLRTSKKEEYTYMGPLAFNDWDPQSKNPVHFTWKLLNWPLPSDVHTHFAQHIRPALSPLYHPLVENDVPGSLSQSAPPKVSAGGAKKGKGTKGGTVDWAAREQRNRELGLAGERLVIEYEQNRLLQAGHSDLAARVEHIALSDSAAGYDILSFEEDGTEKFIEVKTTAGPASTPFYISENEVNVSRQLKDRFWLYRVHSYSREENKGEFYSFRGEVEEHYSLSPIQYRAAVK